MLKTLMLFLAGMSFNLGLLGAVLGLYGVASLGFLLTAFDLSVAFYFGKEGK